MDERMHPFEDQVVVVAGSQSKRGDRIPPSADDVTPRFNRMVALLPLLSARILKSSPETLDEIINESLREILQSLGVERGGLLEVSQEKRRVVLAYAWNDAGIPMVSQELNLAQLFPWTYQQLVVLGKTVARHNIDSIPVEAEMDRRNFVQLGIKSALAIPLFVGQKVHHILLVHSIKKECIWPKSFITNLRQLGEIFVSALARRNVIRSLEISQARLEMAAGAANIGFWEVDLETGIIWLSRQAREIFHIGKEESVTTSTFLEKVHSQDRKLLLQFIKQAQKSETESRVEYRLVNADGQTRWLISRGRLQHKNGGSAKCLMGMMTEITQRKEMEFKLVEQVREIDRLRERLEQENILLREEAGCNEQPPCALGASPAMRRVQKLVDQVAMTDSTVLIQGATGTGKEVIAQAIHHLSDRGKRLMVTVNCAALPSALIESELFGREKGAYTGAVSRQMGRFELAHQSTLFLDEIAELPLDLQAKLLRVLQDGSFERLGSPTRIKSDVRIIAATNRNLEEEMEQGRFRRDLFYRLNIFPIHVPPLRERVEDIPLLTWKFVNKFGQKMGRKINSISRQDMEALTTYDWPGNVRELRNVIERAMITSTGTTLDLSGLDLPKTGFKRPNLCTLEEVERRHILETLQVTGRRVKGKGGAAELLGINPSTLYSRMRKLAIEPLGK